jgi:hypothetical protein
LLLKKDKNRLEKEIEKIKFDLQNEMDVIKQNLKMVTNSFAQMHGWEQECLWLKIDNGLKWIKSPSLLKDIKYGASKTILY